MKKKERRERLEGMEKECKEGRKEGKVFEKEERKEKRKVGQEKGGKMV